MTVEAGVTCEGCDVALSYRGRGRRRRLCGDCKKARAAARARAYREENRAAIAAYQRAWYEENKDEIAARQRASLDCVVCGDRLRHPSETGMCGFCKDEADKAAAGAP